ncbi:MAG TPA: S8 family peptidase [Rhizobacter sp.]|nr:S8 family peptidase [Rhizobacter sp.]
MFQLRQGLAVLLGLFLSGLSQAATPLPVAGLIVKFRDAPASAESAASRAATARSAEHPAHMRRVLQAARMSEARMRPVGRAAQHLSFGRMLSRADAEQMAAQLREQPEVEWVVANERERRLDVPNDPLYLPARDSSGQWWLYPNSAASAGVPGIETAWLTETGQASAIVAVLDTGITAHSELNGRLLPGYDFVSDVEYANDGGGRDADPTDPGDWVDAADLARPEFAGCTEQDSYWHGTVISGLLAARTNNSLGVAGISWNGRVLPVRVAGKCGATVADIVDGMRWAAGLEVQGVPRNPNPARVINISFGGSAACNPLYQSTIDELASIGAVVVAAAGNEAGAPTRPASCKGVVGVAGLRRDGLKASYSNFGNQIVVSTVAGDPASDDGLLTVWNEGLREPQAEGYANVFGTSFAAPIVSGIASLMLSVNPRLTVGQVIEGLRAGARPHVVKPGLPLCSVQAPSNCVCTTSTCGAGIADAPGALQYARNAPLLTATPTASESSGGGALGVWWLLGLALGVVAAAFVSGPRGAQRKRLAQ